MSYCRKEGKDTIVFVTKEDHQKQSTVQVSNPEPRPGLILPDGKINWSCPCLGNMTIGPCGVEFREAFSCFQYSTAKPKGSNCISLFNEMQTCMRRFPTVYEKDDDDEQIPMGDGDTNLTITDEDKSLASRLTKSFDGVEK